MLLVVPSEKERARILFCSLDTGTTTVASMEAIQLQPEVVRNEMTQKRYLISRDS